MNERGIGSLNGKWEWLFKVCLGLGAVAIPAGMAAQGWIINAINDLNIKQAIMEGNRFSSADGVKVWEAVAGIREKMAGLPEEYPPKWFVNRVDRIEENLDKLTVQVLELTRIVAEEHKP